MKLDILLTLNIWMLVTAEQFLHGNKNFVVNSTGSNQYNCVHIKLSFKKFIELPDEATAPKILQKVIQEAHYRFIQRVNGILTDLQSSRKKRSIAYASLGVIATSAIWFFIDNVRNVNAKLYDLSNDLENLKKETKEMAASLAILANATMDNQLRIEEDFGINAILKLMNGQIHPEFVSTDQILQTFSNQMTPLIFDKLIFNKHPSTIYAFAEVAVQGWNLDLEEAALKVCLPTIFESDFFQTENIIHTGFFTKNEFVRYNIPEVTVTIANAQFVGSIKTCTMKGLYHICPSFSLSLLYPLDQWTLTVLSVKDNFVDIQILDNTYLVATKIKSYYILPNYNAVSVPENGIFSLVLNHTQQFLIDGVSPLPGLDNTFFVNDRYDTTKAELSLLLANALENSKSTQAIIKEGILLPLPKEPLTELFSIGFIVIVVGIISLIIILVIWTCKLVCC